MNLKTEALLRHIGAGRGQTIQERDDGVYEVGSSSYLVLTEGEADQMREMELDEHFNEHVLGQVPDSMQIYLDQEAWKQDARVDGRGHVLAQFDGVEHEAEADGNDFYIFRME